MDVKSACAQDVRFVGAETITGEVNSDVMMQKMNKNEKSIIMTSA